MTAPRLDRLMEATWLAVVGAIPLLLNPAGEYPFGLNKAAFLFLGTAFLGALWLTRRTPRTLATTPLLLPALAFALSYLLATALSVAPLTSFWGSLHRIMGTATVLSLVGFFFLLCLNLKSKKQVERLLWTVAASATLVALLGVLEWRRWIPPLSLTADGRIGSTIGHPVPLGAYLVLTMPLTAVLLLTFWRVKGRLPLMVGLALSLLVQGLALVLTAARGPWLGFLTMAGVLVLLVGFYLKRRWTLKMGILSGALAGLLLVGIWMPGSPLQGLKDLPYLSRAASAFDLASGSVKSRLLIWGATLELVRERPVLGGTDGEATPLRHLVGYGPETFRFAFTMVSPRELVYLEGPRVEADLAHNLPLDLLVATGFLGLGSFLFLVGAAYRHAFRALHHTENLQHRLLLTGLIAAVSGYLVEKAFGVAEVADQLMFWTLLALLVAVAGPGKREEPADAPQPAVNRRAPGQKAVALVSALLLVALGAGIAGTTVMADAQAGKGWELVGKQDWSGALGAFDKAVRLAPYRAVYHWHLARASFVIAQELESPASQRRFLEIALDHARGARELEPVNYYYALREAQMHAFAALALDPASDGEAVRLYRRASELSPGDPDLLNEWALYELRNLRVQPALALLQRSLALDASYVMTNHLLSLAGGHSAAGDVAELVRQRGIEHVPYFWDGYLFVADTFYRLGRPQQALDPALRYAQAVPADPVGHRLVAAIYRALGLEELVRRHSQFADALSQAAKVEVETGAGDSNPEPVD